MLVKGVFTQISGSLGGITGSHNRGGQYLRARTVPTDPGTLQQTALRNIFGSLANAWQTVLTAAQRAAWDTYAGNVPVVGPLGDPLVLTGQQMYIRNNTPIVQAGLTRVDDGPVEMALADLSPVSIAIAGGASTISVTFSEDDQWVDEDDAALIVLASREQSPAINFFKGPYRLAGKIDGSSGVPPTSPSNVTSKFAYTSGNKGFVQARCVLADGRVSSPQRVGVLAT